MMDGVFNIEGKERIVLPIAQDEDLATAEIKCVGEQLHDFIAERLGSAPLRFFMGCFARQILVFAQHVGSRILRESTILLSD